VLIHSEYDVLIVANGTPPSRKLLRDLTERSGCLLAVDGGLRNCRKLEIKPDFLIGDLDSISQDDLAWATRTGTAILPRRNQNSTDLEKAMRYCQTRNWRRIAILAVNGNRPDHYLNGIDLAFKFRGLAINYFMDHSLLIPLSGRKTLQMETPEGHTLSWLGWPAADGCCLSGVKWPIKNRALRSGGYQSVSNRTTGSVIAAQKRGRSIFIISLRRDRAEAS
jgi:thiamine pyrophosphokinase